MGHNCFAQPAEFVFALGLVFGWVCIHIEKIRSYKCREGHWSTGDYTTSKFP